MKYTLALFSLFINFVVNANPENCVSCHKQQVSNWQQSDHAQAMAVATDKTVLGDFNDATTTHYTQKARFYKSKKKFLIDSTEKGKTSTYEVIYTFGHYPLQQYLVPADGGRFQVFSFAWDSRPKTEGGQRWYPNYANEDVHSNDRLHWQQPLQNWNGMCADCHSDGLKRNFDLQQNTFNTEWDNINVGCQSCHGKMNGHLQTYKNTKTSTMLSSEQQTQLLNWLLEPGDKVARLKNHQGALASTEQKTQRGAYMNTCFSCHALRAPLTDGFEPSQHIMDQFAPSLLAPPLYHADGQIKEEVYVYGSFLQSKMYHEGVTCIDCHDAHSMKVKSQTNGLCLQCHSAQTYQQEQHIRHPLDSTGAQCVNCHMPETTYMGVDARRDHSFRIPRPDLSIKYDTPNACTNCHQDQSNTWAANALTQWHGQSEPVDKSQQHFMQLMHNRTLPLEQHLALINDETMPEIKRASALAMLPYSTNTLTEYVVSQWVNSEYPLIRLAVAQVGNLLADEDLLKSYKTLLDDKYKAVRVAAANRLVAIGLQDNSSFNKAFKELLASTDNTSWRGEGLFNQSLVDLAAQQEQAAIYKLEQSINIDPYFVSSYVNLADIYRRLKLLDKEAALYNTALNTVTKSAELHYAYGMFLIRSNDKPGAIEQFKQAMKFDSENPQYAYLYFLALDAVGKTQFALAKLKQVFKKYNKDNNLRNLGLSFAQKLRDRASFEFFNK